MLHSPALSSLAEGTFNSLTTLQVAGFSAGLFENAGLFCV